MADPKETVCDRLAVTLDQYSQKFYQYYTVEQLQNMYYALNIMKFLNCNMSELNDMKNVL